MAKTASQIVDRSLTLIDEEPTTFNTAATTETSIRDQALAILPEVCRDLIKELPWELKRYLGEFGALTQITLEDGEDQSGYVKQKVAFQLPSDFWELVSIKLGTWSTYATSYILVDSPEYAKQNNPHTRAGKQNPIVAISEGYDQSPSNRKLECFSILDGETIAPVIFNYIKFTNVPNDSGNTWPDELFDEITKALASELNIIKSRMEEAVIRGEETVNAIDQHE